MFKNKILLITTSFVLFYSEIAYSHSFEGMNGFYDGLSHPVLGLDHFLAMISVGIISAQIGGRAIWTVPSTFVFIMLIGGLIGVYFSGINHVIIEYGIILSVIFLGLGTSAGLLTPSLEAAILLMVIGTTFLAPVLLRLVLRDKTPGGGNSIPDELAANPVGLV